MTSLVPLDLDELPYVALKDKDSLPRYAAIYLALKNPTAKAGGF